MKQTLPLRCHAGIEECRISTELPAFVMGIINVTPDSFWEGSRSFRTDAAEKALEMIVGGADVIDIGGESSRPGAAYVGADEELRRILPVIEEIRRHSDCPISVDTRKKTVMQAAHEAGADILNDISALEDDPELGPYAAAEKIPVILMHKRGIPAIMQNNTAYENVFEEVDSYLRQRAQYALQCGIAEDRIILDPGIGFGKDFAANRTLILRCGELGGGRFPVLMALSRKTCVGDMTGKSIADRLAGTLAANLLSVQNGAVILRVHDVKETRDMLCVMEKLRR